MVSEPYNTFKPAIDFGVQIPLHPEYIISIGDAKELLKRADSSLVSVRSRPEFTGETSGYSYIDKKGDIPGAKWGHGGPDAQSMSDYHNPDGTMRSASEIA